MESISTPEQSHQNPSASEAGKLRKSSWRVVLVFVVCFTSCFSLPLKVHLHFVLTSPRALSDGQYVMIFPFAVASGIVGGLMLAALTIILTKRKPQFVRVAIWVALSYAAFWAVVTTACEAIFVGKGCIGSGVILTLVFLTIGLPLSILCLIFPPCVSGAIALLPLVGALILAFYFTNPRGWRGKQLSTESEPK